MEGERERESQNEKGSRYIRSAVELAEHLRPLLAPGGHSIGHNHPLPGEQTLRLHFIIQRFVPDVVRGLNHIQPLRCDVEIIIG